MAKNLYEAYDPQYRGICFSSHLIGDVVVTYGIRTTLRNNFLVYVQHIMVRDWYSCPETCMKVQVGFLVLIGSV